MCRKLQTDNRQLKDAIERRMVKGKQNVGTDDLWRLKEENKWVKTCACLLPALWLCAWAWCHPSMLGLPKQASGLEHSLMPVARHAIHG